jgi:lysozyme family protein
MTFDYGVNSGTSRAVKALQKAVGVSPDGKSGPATIAATRTMNSAVIVDRIANTRLSFLQGLTSWKTFGKGWGRRVGEVKAKALLMAGATATVILADAADQSRKATNDNKASKGAVAGGAASGGGAVASQSGGIDWLQLGALAIAAVVLIGCGIILYRRANARREMAAAMVAVVAK